MELKARIDTDIKDAMRSGEKAKLAALRFLMSKIKNKEIDGRKALSEEETLQVITASVKQLDDAIEQYRQAGRDELASKELAEKEFLMAYLPKQMNESEVRSALEDIVRKEGISGQKDFGRLMKVASAELKGKADGRLINTIARELLA